MKKIIFISGIQIFPPESGGQLRSANICRSLVKLGVRVEIYSFTGRKKEYLQFKNSSEKVIENNLTEFTNRSLTWGVVQFLFYRLKLPPIWITLLTKIYLPKALRTKMNEADSFLLDFPYLYPITEYSKKTFRMNTHNAEFTLNKNVPLIATLVKNIELKCFKKVKHIFFCNILDKQAFIDDYPELDQKSSLLPNGVDLSQFRIEHCEKESIRKLTRQKHNIDLNQKIILFTGSQYFPNLEAFNYLRHWAQENVQDLIELNILILVVGTVSQNLINETNFKVIGKVEKIMPYLYASDYGINPVNLGSGTNVKMIEFLASHLPILTTEFGARGLKLVNGENCFYFERDQLGKILKYVAKQKLIERHAMAKRALEENRQYVDMTNALGSLNINW